MADNEEQQILDYQISLDPSAVIEAGKKFQKKLSENLRAIERNETRLSKSFHKYLMKISSSRRIFEPVLQEQVRLFKDTTTAIAESTEAILEYQTDIASTTALLEGLRAEEATASGDRLKAVQDEIKAKEVLMKKSEAALSSRESIRKQQESTLERVQEASGPIVKQLEIEPTLLPDLLRDAGEELVAPFAAFARKDLLGAMKAGGTLAGKAFKGFQAMGKVDTAGGQMGGVLKGIASLSNKMGPILDLLSKFAPILGLVGTVLASLVKLFLDAEADAKAFNKQVMETSSLSGYLAKNMGDVGKAAQATERAMYDARDNTINRLDNVAKNITKETHAAVLGALGAEGVPLATLNQQIAEIGKTSKMTADRIQNVGDVTWMATAYSRQFGVSLSEITQIQGDMMSEVGMGLKEVRKGFAAMEVGARDAGMESNKFFGIVRSFSSDLSLFTLRMADLTKVLTVLGKTMSPRNAQKFLQTITQQFKGAGLLDRTKSVLLGGKGATQNILKDDSSRRIEGLMADLRHVGSTDELKGSIQSGNTDEVQRLMSQLVNITSAQREAILDATEMQKKLNTNNTIEIASALRTASPMAAIQMLDQIARTRIGKPMTELVGIEKVAFESMTGFNDEQLDQQRKMMQGLTQMRYDLASKLERSNGDLAALSDTERSMLDKLGLSHKSSQEMVSSLREQVSNEDVWHSMDATEQDLLKSANATEDYQEKIAGLQQTMTQKMEILVDFLMGSFYNVVMDLYDAFIGMWDSIRGMFGSAPSAEIVSRQRANRQEFNKIQAQRASSNESSPSEAAAETTDSVDQVNRTLKKGVALARPTNAYNTASSDATLEAIRQGLFEYYMYSGMDRSQVAAGMATGMNPMALVRGIVGATTEEGSVGAGFQRIQANAVGGIVSGLAGNMANVDRFPPAPPGEGWAAVRPGETIVPAGGRGGGGSGVKVELQLKGDLRRFIDARVVEGSADFQRNRRLR